MVGEREVKETVGIAWKVILGVVFPVILLHFDPFLLGRQNGDSLVGGFSRPMYVLMLLSMLAFLGQLFSWCRTAPLAGLSAGAIASGSLLSALLGAVLLPFSIVGIRLYGFGLLGLYPWIVSVLYFQAARSAIHRSGNPNPLRPIAGFVMAVAIPLILMLAANRELDRLTANAGAGKQWSTAGWRAEQLLTWAGDSDRIVSEYQRERTSPLRRQNLSSLYRNLTGREIEARLEQLRHLD